MAYSRITIKRVTDVYPDHAAQVGRIALSWNAIHAIIFMMFEGFAFLDRQAAAAIFYTLKADSAQRDITRALGVAILSTFDDPKAPEINARFIELFKKLGNFAGVRNGAIHGAILIDQNGEYVFNPFQIANIGTPRETLFTRLDEEFEKLDNLNEECVNLYNELAVLLEWPAESPE